MSSIKVLGADGVFAIQEGLLVTILSSGVYKQCEVYAKNNQVYAKIAGGFVALSRDGICSKSPLKWKWFSSSNESHASLEIGVLGWIVLSKSKESQK